MFSGVVLIWRILVLQTLVHTFSGLVRDVISVLPRGTGSACSQCNKHGCSAECYTSFQSWSKPWLLCPDCGTVYNALKQCMPHCGNACHTAAVHATLGSCMPCHRLTRVCVLYWGPAVQAYIDGLVQERRNSSANALELRLPCTNPWL